MGGLGVRDSRSGTPDRQRLATAASSTTGDAVLVSRAAALPHKTLAEPTTLLHRAAVTASWTNGTERYRFSTIDDLPRFADMLSDPEVGRWLWFTPAPVEMFGQFFRPLIEKQTEQLNDGKTPPASVFSVEDADQAFLGQGAVLAIEGSPGGFEIGFQLRREAWGQGVGTRLAGFLTAFAVHRCSAYRLEGSFLEGNNGSEAILKRLGLQLEGRRPGYRERDGVRHTEVIYGAEVRDLDTAAIRQAAVELGLLGV